MSKYELTKAKAGLPREKVSIGEDDPTANMVEYGIRTGATSPEYFLADRLEKLRCVAIELISQLESEGYMLDPLHLQVIDVQVEVSKRERLTL